MLGDGRPRERALRVGSVKTNIGHLEAAAGMAGLIKVALAMHHGALPPSLHFQKPNPHIDFDGLRIRVQSTLEAWEPESGRRLAGVSSFGFGGTNAHVVVEGVEPDVARPVGKLAWLFTGQGAQTVGMGQGLHQDWPAFRAALDAAFAALDPHLARPLREVMWAAPGTEDAAQLHQTAYTQPALFAIEWALAALWRSWGVEPDFVTGHSIGEIAAACVAGVFALGDAARLVCARGRLMQALPPGGAMIAIEATELEVAAALGPHAGVVSVAAVNGPESVVLAGAEEPVEAIAATLAERGVSGRRLRVSHAFHSPSMDPMLAAFRREAETIQYSAPSLPLVSTLTGALAGAEIATPEYWVRHAREGVRFAAAVKSLHDAGATMFLEIGPKATLLGLVDGVLPDARPTLLPSLRPGQPEAEGAEESLAELFASKRPIDMKRLLASGDGPRGHRLPVLAVGATSGRSARAELVVLSAKTPAALGAYARRLAEHLGSHGGANADANLPDVAYSLLTTRSSLEHRVALAVPTREALVEALLVVGAGEGSSAEEPPFDVSSGSAPKVAFVFPGQGSQWLGMGRELLAQEPAFRASLARSDRAIASEAGWSVLEELSAPAETSRLGRLEIVQPVLFAVEVALADLWRSWGVEPQAVVGHSMGEVAAACVSGALSVEDGAAVICRRSGLLTRLSGQGEMALVELSHEQAQGELAGFEDRLSVAVSNGRRSTVISGEPAAMATVLGRLESRGIFCRRVNVDFASHSPQVEPVLGELTAKLAGLSPGATQVAFRSTVRGKELSGSELTGGYWSENLRAPVRFGETIESLVSEGFTLFVEMSPHPMLVSSVEEIQRGSSSLGVSVGSLRREQPERLTMLASLGALHVHGHPLDATRLFPSGGRRVRLPTYAWQRERHWLEAPSPEAKGRDRLGGHPLLGPSTRLSSPVGTWLWEAPIDLQRLAWLTDHRVQGAAVLPAAAYLEMALAVGHELAPGTPIAIAGVEITQVLAVPDTGSVVVQVVASEEASGVWRVQVASRVPEDASATWSTHARVRVRRVETEPTLAPMDLASWRQRFGEPVDIAALYTRFASAGLEYGPAFRGIRELRRNATDGLAQIALPPTVGSARTGGPWWIHPSLLDACLQTMESLLLADGSNATWLPVGVDSLRVPARVSGALGCLVTLRAGASSAPDRRVADLVIFDEAGARVAEIVGLTMRRVADASTSQRPEDEWLLGHRWEPRALPLPRVTAGRWLLVGDGAALGQKLGRTLRDAGHAVSHAVALGSTEPSDRAVDDTNPQALRALLNEAFGGQAPSAIVHLRSLEKGDDPDPLEASLARGCDGALALVKATAGMSWRDPPRLWVVTRGAQSVGAGEDDVSFLQAPVLGLARVIAMEHGELRCARVDLDARAPEGEVRDLCAELLADADEDEVAWRGGTRRTLRLVRVLPEPVPAATLERASGRPFGLRIAAPGVLDGLELARLPRRAPGPGEVEIEVEAAGINFRDVLLSLGVIPDEHLPEDPAREDGASAAAAPRPVQPGVECAGRIIALGPGVTGLAVGDAAIAFARRGAMASHVTTPASLVARRPLALSPAQGASVPVVYLTAWYALEKVARLRRGERVLIHAATGGVGLAAVQWAQHVGAEIHATAGTPEKSALLESMGVAFVSDSRSDRFVAEVMANTRGEGVDVVLNSLSGDLIAKSFGLLRPFGRFVELGKRDYYADSALGLRPFVKGLSFSLVDLHGMMVERPAWVGDLLSELLGHFESGVFSPPKVETFPIGSVQEAFRKMAQGHHTGKLAVTLGPAEREQAMIRVLSQEGEGGAAIRDDGTYLVTGGLGGLGLSVAGWLARRGARHIVLAGRSEVTSET
ncbi:MAG TPA: acyltransferase domain-containing protein, partial [Polyangiaceae bacterium]|nr:acyltransferase domain-containing protein [Polyangiaceae bacterium]